MGLSFSGGGGGGGSAFTGSVYGKTMWVAPDGDDANPGSPEKPKATIGAAVTALGNPVDAADERVPRVIMCYPGAYDEAVSIPYVGIWQLIPLGICTLGDAAAGNFESTTTRNLTFAPDQGDRQGEVRPSLMIDGSPTNCSSTHWVYSGRRFHISGDLVITSNTSYNDIELHLCGTKIKGVVNTTPGTGTSDVQVHMQYCMIDGSGTSFSNTDHIYEADSCEFDGLISVDTLGVINQCEIGSITFNGWTSSIKPTGFFGCSISGTVTSTGTNYRADGATQYHSSGVTLSGCTLDDMG